MDYLDFAKDMARADIKNNKKFLWGYRFLLYFSIAFLINDIDTLYYNHHWVTALVTGMMFTNVLFFLLQSFNIKDDLKYDKERLAHLENLTEDENFKGMMTQLKLSKEHYDKLIDMAIKTQNRINAVCRENKPQESASPKAEM